MNSVTNVNLKLLQERDVQNAATESAGNAIILNTMIYAQTTLGRHILLISFASTVEVKLPEVKNAHHVVLGFVYNVRMFVIKSFALQEILLFLAHTNSVWDALLK
jgi:hypothetical protein